jgi:hypothetical protein
VRAVRAPWTSGSFLLYAGAFLAVGGAIAWLAVIESEHGSGDFAGFATVFWAIAEALALWLLAMGRRLIAGLAAFVGLVLWAVMLGALFTWWDWLPDNDGPIQGFHWGTLALELLILLAAVVDLLIWRHPLLTAIAAPAAWLFVTDVVSSGGNWTTTVTLLAGLVLFAVGLSLDSGEWRPFGFWVHLTAGLLIGAAFLIWWHSGDGQWVGIIVVALVFIFVGAGLRRSSYAVLGAIGLSAATAHYAGEEVAGRAINGEPPMTWALPVAYLSLGVFLVLLGWLLSSQGHRIRGRVRAHPVRGQG